MAERKTTNFGITLTMSVIMGVWKELFAVIARGLYNWRLYQSREVELILFFVTFGVLVVTVLLGIRHPRETGKKTLWIGGK